ncbi:MAG: selenite/tellurite reduction operon rhodanese-like protein ExtH [Pelovirga sp.]
MNKFFTWMKQSRLSLLLALILATGLLVSGCGSDSYDTPKSTQTTPINGAATDVLIDVDTLKSWIDSGRINDEAGFDSKVVILDYYAYNEDNILEPRIPGACRVTRAELDQARFEGVGLAAPLVATGAQMDALIQRLGIDDDTTIVFTTSGAAYYATRAYWIFRYWGFPKERLKLLDGGQTAFAAAYPELMTTNVPSPDPSTYSVRNLPALNDDLRASIGEMIEIVKTDLTSSTSNLVIDARGPNFYLGNAATSGLVGGEVVVFDGHPVGGEYLSQGDLFTSGKFKSAAEIQALFVAKGWEPGKKVTVYCTSGYSATPLFFALDAILDVPVQLHDGSWSQTGKYSENNLAGGQIPYGSVWALDKYMDPITLNYNNDIAAPATIESLIYDADLAQPSPFNGDNPADDSDVVQSQIEAADEAFAPGGGGTDFSAPVLTATDEVLIDYNTLKAWVDADLVNAPLGGERVVIVDVSSTTAYAAGHIPGAVNWTSAGVNRYEGPSMGFNMVLPGETFEDMIQSAGIDENTTIVITSAATSTFAPSRIYFHFRYWGFPKERIKVLNGYNAASWPKDQLTTVAPTVTPSDLALADLNSGAQTQTRVSLAELMDAARDERGMAIDFRGDKLATLSTTGVFPPSGDHVVFEGYIRGSKFYPFGNFLNPENTFKTYDEIVADLNNFGIDVDSFTADGSFDNPAYAFCRAGNIGGTCYFVLDAILGIDTMLYDGSWSQWGSMSANAAKGGELGDYGLEAWAVDSLTYMDAFNYNVDHVKKVEPLNPDADALKLSPADANQVEDADYEYQITPPADSGSNGGAPPTSVDNGAPVGC